MDLKSGVEANKCYSDLTGKNNCIFDCLFKHIHCEIM
jgi:hypothetical protein